MAPHANLISYDVCDDQGYCLSWIVAGQNRANNAQLKLGGNGALGALATVGAAGQVHLVVDVNGYFE